MDYDSGLKNLRILIDQVGPPQDLNEATTRLRFIDRLIFECFGWERDDCIAEDRYEGRYTDYSLHAPECLLIVEAKKEGISFELPIGVGPIRQHIQFFRRSSPQVFEAVAQAMGYCQTRGTPFGAVANGHQLIAFIATRSDGKPPLEGDALVFESLDILYDNFLLAWQCLSKAGVQSRRLAIELLDTQAQPVPEKLAPRSPEYPGYKLRNSLQTDLQILSDIFIDDLAGISGTLEEREALEATYCQSGALSQYAMVSKEILRVRYSALFQQEARAPTLSPLTTREGVNQEFLAEAFSHRPILLIGDRGVGKTTFIKHLFKVDDEGLFTSAIVFYINFGERPAVSVELEQFTAEEIKRQLLDVHGIDITERNFIHGVLHGELLKFDNSFYSDLKQAAPDEFARRRTEFIEERLNDRDEFLKLCLTHIYKAHQKQIIVFLDNVDQRPDDFQEKVFLIGTAMAASWPAMVYVSIRPETFNRSRVSGSLSAYHARAFTISPPRVDDAIRKRLIYGIDLLGRGLFLGSQGDISVRADSLRDYLTVLEYSFDKNPHLVEFLDNMCGGNIRLAFDFIRAFLGSGHVDTQKILDIYRTSGNYTVPLHEFLRAVIFGDHIYYYPPASEILNVFDISSPEPTEHFLVPILLSQLERWSQNSPTDGFVAISSIYTFLQNLSFEPRQINWNLPRLVQRNLIETPTKERNVESSPGALPVSYRLTTIGAYYIRRLMHQFTYIDAMAEDTPITSEDYRNEISAVHSLEPRLQRARRFCDYLDSIWPRFQRAKLAFSWPVARRNIINDIVRVERRIAPRREPSSLN